MQIKIWKVTRGHSSSSEVILGQIMKFWKAIKLSNLFHPLHNLEMLWMILNELLSRSNFNLLQKMLSALFVTKTNFSISDRNLPSAIYFHTWSYLRRNGIFQFWLFLFLFVLFIFWFWFVFRLITILFRLLSMISTK